MKSKKLYISAIYILLLEVFSLNLHAQSLLDKRVNELCDAMTTQEKINQLINSSFGGTPSNTRLGIPGFFMDDGPHGLRLTTDRNGRSGTAFPTGIAMAATWDEDIAKRVGEAMGLEFWAFNRSQQLGPCVDICRDPRGGRSAESGGEDAYLAGHIGKSIAIGIQKNPIIATVKHYMGESMQVNRHHMSVQVSDRWLMDFAGYNFRTVIQEAGVMSVMGAYNLVNGDKACESAMMQTEILRKRWGYPFYVVSDWDAIFDSGKALKAGTDICMGSNKYTDDLPGLVASGTISIAELDKAVKHVLKTKILHGMLDYFPRGNESFAKTTEINATNLLAAQKSIVLLKNEKIRKKGNILPLKKDIKIALVGPNALGENLNCFGSSETFPPYSINILEGIEAKIGKKNVTYTLGCDVNSESTTDFDAAKKAAKSADVVIFAGGLDATQEGEGFSTGTDRKGGSIALPGKQQQLINELAAVNPNIVVIIQSGGVCSLNACIGNIKGLINSFYAAQEAGTAIADVLFGDYSPGGKMPVTMPKNDSDLPDWTEETFSQFTKNLDGGYRWFDEKKITPEFAFGAGLSYTTFAYSKLKTPKAVFAGQPITVQVDVTNTGKVNGEEVAQLYISSPSIPEIWMPRKQLRGFKRIALAPGETKTVSFDLTADDFYYWNGKQYQTQTGKFIFKVGGASDRLSLSKSVMLTAGEQQPDLKITQVYTMPRYPLKGQKVSFYALVKNQGNAATASNYNIDYKINGVNAASSKNISTVIAPGQVQLIASDEEWTATAIKKTELSASVTINGNEWSSANNCFKRDFEIFNPKLDPSISNLAYRKPIKATSNTETNPSTSLVDGDYTSRWESGQSDNESATIDLSLIADITNVSILWEAAFARNYKIESSLDGVNWSLLKSVSNGTGGSESFAVNAVKSRYVRISMLERTPIEGKKYGFSIYEVEVNGNILQQFPTIQLAPVESKLYLPFGKTIFNASQSGNPLKAEKLTYRWKQISGPEAAQIEDSTAAVTIAKFNKTGNYIFSVTVGNEMGSNSKEFSIEVLNPTGKTDLAFMKPTSCSGVESNFTSSEMAVDGDKKTRWASAFKENEWWLIDLQHLVLPQSIEILWEDAFAKSFNIQISSDNKNWKQLYSENAFKGGKSEILNSNSLSGRYLKVNCVTRATPYGSSFFTFNCNGTFINSKNNAPMANAGENMLVGKTLTLNGSRSYDTDKDVISYKWEQISGPTELQFTNNSASTTTATNLKSGDYYLKLTVDDGKDIDFDIVKITCNKSEKTN